jgi:2-dehydro-3-deoxygluconokinase
MLYDLVALGETMIALAPPSGGTLRDVDRLLVDHAGAESNTCVGLSRLGLQVAWISRLGADAAGDRIHTALAAEGIDMRWVRRDATRPTGLMLKEPGAGVRYCRTGSAASAMGPEVLDGVPIADARAVLVTGVTALIGSEPQAAGLALLESARGLRIVDPNLRPGLWGSHRRAELVLPFIERCDLLLAGSAELEELLGGGDAHALAQHAAARGPKEVVVRGAVSIGVLTDVGWEELEIRRDAAVDPIGAGDAFNAGYLAVRLRGGTIADALRAGALCGAAVTSTSSDTAGLPRTLSDNP